MLSSRPAVSHRIRSFVMRAGRMTAAQERGWKEGFPRFGLDVRSGLLDWEGTFSESGRRIVEIGFGMGDSLLEMALADPIAPVAYQHRGGALQRREIALRGLPRPSRAGCPPCQTRSRQSAARIQKKCLPNRAGPSERPDQSEETLLSSLVPERPSCGRLASQSYGCDGIPQASKTT